MTTATHQPRRRELTVEDPATIRNILACARFGNLATVDPEGYPEVRPLNYGLAPGRLYFHTSPHGRLSQCAGQPAAFTAADAINWIPSYWRTPELACPATTYYRSVVARGRLEAVQSRDEKAEALESFMQRYQPEGGYVPFSDERYTGPLAALQVLRLELEDVACKVKYGQHLTGPQRRQVYEGLLERRTDADLDTAEKMVAWNEDLKPCDDGLTRDPVRMPADRIWELLRPTYWAHKRSPEIVAQNRQRALAQVGVLEAGRLIGYARVENSWLYDVIVDPSRRGQGIGKQLMAAILDDPRVQALSRIFLDTRDAMPLYQTFGFETITVTPWGSSTMVRYQGSPR